MNPQHIIIIGAGPAGLTAAYELSERTDYRVTILEMDSVVGGISRTVDYKNNKIDIGGHRFFSKSEKVIDWWQQFLPIHGNPEHLTIAYQGKQKELNLSQKETEEDKAFLVRSRHSRIFYNKKLFDYPLKLNLSTFLKIGFFKSIKIGLSLVKSRLLPIKEEESLEDFYINRFGKELYQTFFKDYTEKVWGVPCEKLSADWGRQRVKNLGLRQMIYHSLKKALLPKRLSFGNKDVVQTLTEYFLYPSKGPGQLWEEVASKCRANGVEIILNTRVEELDYEDGQLKKLTALDLKTKVLKEYNFDYAFSTMPIRNLVQGWKGPMNEIVRDIALKLEYRSFMIVGILLEDLKLQAKGGVNDNWLYIQDSFVNVGRVQIFNNWSPFMVSDKNKTWIGAEYFCDEGDELWNMKDQDFAALAIKELTELGFISADKVLDTTVIRTPKAYPSYTGVYDQIDKVQDFFTNIPNLFLVGRNGMHKYNNQDHSMLTAMKAVDLLIDNNEDKQELWSINTEQEYHEELEQQS